jgi:hypothetical protein
MASYVRNCVRGSGTVSKWLKDTKDGKSGLDFLIVGDSNTGYGEPLSSSVTDTGARKYGLLDGLAQALINNGFNMYASPLYNFTSGAPSFYIGLGSRNAVGNGNISGSNIQNNNASANIGLLGQGASGNTEFNYFYQQMSGDKLNTNLYSVDHGSQANWHLITTTLAFSGTGNTYRLDALGIDSEPWLNEKPVAYYRVTHSFTTNGGNTGATVTANGAVLNVSPTSFIQAGNGGTAVNPYFKDSEFLLPRAAQPHTLTNGAVSIRLLGFYNTFTAPIGLFFHSIYEKKIGFATTPLYFESGLRVDEIRDKMINVSTPTTGNVSATQEGKFIGQLLAAVVRRQLDAFSRNKGRVCVILQGGTNQSAEGTDTKTRAIAIGQQYRTIINLIEDQWKQQNLNPSNLAFLILSSPLTNNTEMPYLSKVLSEFSGAEITALDHVTAMPQSEYVTNTYWDGADATGSGSVTPASHLTETGYVEWGSAIVKNLLPYNTTLNKLRK